MVAFLYKLDCVSIDKICTPFESAEIFNLNKKY